MLNRGAAIFSEYNLITSFYFRFNQLAIVGIFTAANSDYLALLGLFLSCGIGQLNATSGFFFLYNRFYYNMTS